MLDQFGKPVNLPGGQLLKPPSKYKCPKCGNRPRLAMNPAYPAGTPEANVVNLNGTVTLHCLPCLAMWTVKQILQNVPQLVPYDPDESAPAPTPLNRQQRRRKSRA